MARPLPLLWLPLLLTLLSSLWAPTRAGGRKLVVWSPSEVHGSPGKTVNLPCALQPLESEKLWVTQIRWKRLKPWGTSSTVAEFDWVRGPRILVPRVQFFAAGKGLDLDQSLTLTELHPNDDANYTCEVTTFPQGSGRASTWLRVSYAPQVSISLYDDIGQQGRREINLSCDARGNPEPRSYEWSTSTGPLPPYAVPQGAWLRLLPSEESINNTFICLVSNALGKIQVAMEVLLPGPSREQSRSPSIFMIVLIVGFALVLGFVGLPALIYLWCSRKSHKSLLSGTLHTSLSDLSLQRQDPFESP